MTGNMSQFYNDLLTNPCEISQTDELPAQQNYKKDSPKVLKWLYNLVNHKEGAFNVQKAIETLDIKISFEDMSHESAISGYIEHLPPKWRIVVSRYENSGRQRFTMAHELAHILFHRDLIERKTSEDKNKRFSESIKLYRSKNNYKHEEMEANTFAAELLMPSHEFRLQWKRYNIIQPIADYFDVSLYAAEYRASKLQLLPKKEFE